MSTTALSTAGRFPVRRKRPNRPPVDNASRLVASVARGPVQLKLSWRGSRWASNAACAIISRIRL
jgi:hypothetical protein